MSADGSQSGPLFNAFVQGHHLDRRFSDQQNASPQAASSGYGDAAAAGYASGYASPALSAAAVASAAKPPAHGLVSQQPPREISLSLLQALLKPAAPPAAAPAAQMSSGSQSPMQPSDSERVLSRPQSSAFVQPPQADAAAQASPMEQLRRMMAAQSAGGSNAQHAAQLPPALMHMAASASAAQPAQAVMPTYAPHRPSPAGTTAPPMPTLPEAAAAPPPSSTKAGTHAKKRTRPLTFSIDLKKVKLRAKPETVPISLLQQPTRFRQGRLVSVSREYICYAVRSKEGGHIRVIHQLQGQRVKMVGHTDSIIDMEFHPCSRESSAHQVLASVGKDNRLIVWLVGPVDTEAASSEGAIAYEPFINIDSGGDARFTCLAWCSKIVENTIELCVGTDKGFMVMKAPAPSAKGKMPDSASNVGLNVMPVATESAVTAIARAGLHWVIVATADNAVRIYQLDGRWESSSQPYRVVCEVTRGDCPVDTAIYVPPATAADGTGHLITGSSMNRTIQLWWLGNAPQQIALLQTTTMTAAAARSSPTFAKLAWSEQTRCLAVGASHVPSAMFVFRADGQGAEMHLGYPQGYDLGDDQPTLSIVTAQEPHGSEASPDSALSIYGVHARLVQQLQLPGLPAVNSQDLPDPAAIYADPSIMALFETPSLAGAPASWEAAGPAAKSVAQAAQAPAAGALAQSSAQDAGAAPFGDAAPPATYSIQSEIAAALSSLQLGSTAGPIKLDPESEERLVERIGKLVETRVADGVAAAMERTLIPAYSRATAAMFEQMQTTFEAGLREWWTRFAQAAAPESISDI
ncbi:hypothetical protein LPJ61_001313 [Coemansia biformis]|uniref:WD40 repeat-like protein n=1 Tax=Coemansia biformis TaxID=1286918 RepID=A0A9W7YEK6_9FUNG|nr:hypothetical protein LPJ61_001313 [Coemansia biformis]